MNEQTKELFDSLKKPSLGQIIIAVALIFAIISVILSIACLSGIAALKDSVKSIAADVAVLSANNTELSNRISSLEVTVDNTQNALRQEASEKYIQITKQPSSVETVVGREDAMMFSVEVSYSGSGLTFTWQIKGSDGTWKDLVFDGDSTSATYGIRLYQDASKGQSQLWAKNLTEAAFGTYRCVISDSAGSSVTTSEVAVSQRAG